MRSALSSRSFAALILLAQMCLIGWLGWVGANLASDNSIETFAVEGTRTEQEYALLTREFKSAEQFMVAVALKPEADRPEVAESVLQRFGQLPGIENRVTLGGLFPDGAPNPMPLSPIPFRLEPEHLTLGYFQPTAGPERNATLAAVRALAQTIASEQQGVSLHLAGEPLVNYELDQGSLEVKYRFFPLLILLSLLLLAFLFRDGRVLLVTALATGGSLATTTGLMGLMGEKMNLVSTLIPALIFVLAIAMQIHVLVSIAAHGNILQGLKAKLRCNFLVSLTTFIGFGSLVTSQVKPIATMGLFMALGIWVIFIWAHAVHLSLSRLLNLCPRMPNLELLGRLFQLPPYQRLVAWPGLKFLAFGVLLLGAWCLRVNPTESNGLRYFNANHPIRVDTAYLEQHITGSSQLEVLLPRPEPPAPNDTDAYVPEPQALARLEQGLANLPHVRHLLSLNRLGSFASACEEGGTEVELSESFAEPFISTRYYRIQLLVDSLDRESYTALRAAILDELARNGFKEGHLTGVLDRIMEIQRYLLGSLLKSLIITVLTVVALLIFLLGRGTPLTAICLPNLFPLATMAIAMLLLGIPTTISSVMVFSVAFGIAVDDTIHLIHTYRHQPAPDHATRWAETLTFDARAVTLTTLVLTFGFSVLTTSSFLPTLHFGVLMCCGMVSALLGDLIILPGLLASFQRTRATKSKGV